MGNTPLTPPPGPDVPGWPLLSLVGEGGMGRVYRAERASDGRQAALIDVTKEFAHPNVAKVLQGRPIGGTGDLFLATEFLVGGERGARP